MIRRLAPLIAMIAAACAQPGQLHGDGAIPVARDIVLILPGPGDLGRSLEAVQMVTARRGEDTHVFEARLSLKGDRLLMVGTDSLGRRAMTVTWEGRSVRAERADWLPDSLKPENILADMVLLYWPEPVVASSVKGAGVAPRASGRSIGDAIKVGWDDPDPWNGRAWLVNESWGYRLDVRSVTVTP